jgi:hypothetical protein
MYVYKVGSMALLLGGIRKDKKEKEEKGWKRKPSPGTR